MFDLVVINSSMKFNCKLVFFLFFFISVSIFVFQFFVVDGILAFLWK